MGREWSIPLETNMQKDMPSTPEKNKDNQVALKQFIMESSLSVRATNVLLANVGSLEELNLMDENILSSFQNCGRKTIQEIQSFVHAIRFQGGIQAPVSTKELLSAPPIKSTIALLAWKNFGKKSINELKKIVLSLCLTGSYSPYNGKDVTKILNQEMIQE